MSLDKKTGLALGFGIGAVIALAFFGISWLMNRPNVIKTQVLTEPPKSTPIASPADTTTNVTNVEIPIGSPSNDNLVNKITPTQQDMVNDIENRLKKLYGTPTATP